MRALKLGAHEPALAAIVAESKRRQLSERIMATTRREFLATGIAAGTAGGLAGCGKATPGSWNIVWIIADDLSPDLSCYGSTELSTPNIDRLAEAGHDSSPTPT